MNKFQVLVNIKYSSYTNIALTSQVLKFDTAEDAEFAINELKNDSNYTYHIVRLYPHSSEFDVHLIMKDRSSGFMFTVIALDEKEAEDKAAEHIKKENMSVESFTVHKQKV